MEVHAHRCYVLVRQKRKPLSLSDQGAEGTEKHGKATEGMRKAASQKGVK